MDMTLLDSIFGKEQVTEEYIPFCDILLLAFRASGKEEESDLYEQAGFKLMNTPNPKKEWGRQLIEIAQKIDKRNIRLGRFI